MITLINNCDIKTQNKNNSRDHAAYSAFDPEQILNIISWIEISHGEKPINKLEQGRDVNTNDGNITL